MKRPPAAWTPWAGGALLLVLVALLYGRALGYPFVYDDRVLILGNPSLADWSTLPEALRQDLFHFSDTRTSPYWRPVVTLSYYLDYALGSGAPEAFHRTNLLALGAAGCGLYVLLLRLGVGAAGALAIAALFLAHPLQVEGAVNVAGRTDVLCAAFGVWALAARSQPAVWALTLAACCSKEIGVFLPLAAWLLGPARSTSAPAVPWRSYLNATLLFMIVRGLIVSALELAPEDAPGPDGASIAGAGVRTLWFAGRLLAPTPLAPALTLEPASGALAAAGWFALLALVGAGWIAAGRLRSPGVGRAGAMMIVLPLLTVSGLANAETRYGETFLVLPLMGLSLALSPLVRPRVGPIAAACAALLAAAAGAPRVADWSSEIALWRAASERVTGDPQIQLNLARAIGEDEPAAALAALEGVRFDDPRREREAAAARAWALLRLGREDEALPWLIAALADEPEAAWAAGNACLLAAPRQHPSGSEICALARQLNPEDPDVANASGLLYGIAGRHEEALPHFERAVELAPEREELQRNLTLARRMLGVEGDAPR